MSRIEKLTKLIHVSTKNYIHGYIGDTPAYLRNIVDTICIMAWTCFSFMRLQLMRQTPSAYENYRKSGRYFDIVYHENARSVPHYQNIYQIE
ncbi:hypothetical protein ARALYDRAFT_920943 [Arabidopsis lyrata subsp. lyrata]|uniref:Uncharacterized protein n=1 Tax=Arabidopsis lyrata subsp. lyrata TaxID=81972 RepID=D7MW74_ARALL|nr:hypothetical protein ARALYDRAFT_920943 [Arabidopsis lyrata subsp. lyrata]